MIGWVVLVILVLTAGYYLFLAPPPEVLISPSLGFVALQPISQIPITPGDVASSTQFQMLNPAMPQPATSSPANVGRTNPFLLSQ